MFNEEFRQREKNLNEQVRRAKSISHLFEFVSFLLQISFLQSEQARLNGELQHYENSLADKDEQLKTQSELNEQFEQRYRQLEEKHREQHATMMKVRLRVAPIFTKLFLLSLLQLSTHLAARESEAMAATTTDPNAVNESWNAILTMNKCGESEFSPRNERFPSLLQLFARRKRSAQR